MRQRAIGRTAVRVTDLGFGAASIGNLRLALDDATAEAAVRAAWDGGVRYFDTAPHYGLGLSEQRLGSALADRPREQLTVSTKVGRLLVPNPAPAGSDLASGGFDVPDSLTRQPDYSTDGVLRSLESSLRRLRLDRVDIVYIHDPEDNMEQAVTEAVPALADLRDQGVVGAIGVGMNHVAPLRRFVYECDIDVIMVAGRWTLVDRSAQALLDLCLRRYVSVVAAAPFNSGLLALHRPSGGAHFNYQPAPQAMLKLARKYAQICDHNGQTLPHAAIQFPLCHAAVASVVAGISTAAEASADIEWASKPLPEHLWRQLEMARPDPAELL